MDLIMSYNIASYQRKFLNFGKISRQNKFSTFTLPVCLKNKNVGTNELITLNNGEKMPKCGLGLWKGADLSVIEAAIDNALEAGYRLFDTAYYYETEDVLGKSWNLSSSVNLLDDPVVNEIADKHKKASGQILLKYLLELDVAVVPRTTKTERLKQNIDIFDFELNSEDLKKMVELEKGESGRTNHVFKNLKDHPEAPF